MKAIIRVRRTKGVIWRTIIGLPISLLMVGIILFFQFLLKIAGSGGVKIVNESYKVRTYMKASSFVGKIGLFLLYLPYFVLSIIFTLLVLVPAYFLCTPLEKLFDANVKLVLWIQYRAALPEEREAIQKSAETLKAKLRDQGATEKQLADIFGSD